MGLEMQMDHVTAERDAGDIPDDQIADVVYRDLVADPLGTSSSGSTPAWDLPISEEFRAALDVVPGRPPHRPRRRARLLLRRHRARPGDPPGPGARPTRSASGSRPRSDRRSLGDPDAPTSSRRPRRSSWTGSSRQLVGPGRRRRPGQGLLRRCRRLPRRRRPQRRRGLPGRPADTRPGSGCSISLMRNERGGRARCRACTWWCATSRRPGGCSSRGGVDVTGIFHFEDGASRSTAPTRRGPTTRRSSPSTTPTATAGWSRRSRAGPAERPRCQLRYDGTRSCTSTTSAVGCGGPSASTQRTSM